MLTFPSHIPISEMTIGLKRAVSVARSPFSLHEQLYDWGGEAWEVDIALSPLDKMQENEISAFMLSAKAGLVPFLFYIPATSKQGSYAGSPVVDGSGITGNELTLKGLTPDASNVVAAGDWFSLGGNLHRFISSADADSEGKATARIAPSLRIASSDGEPINYDSPAGRFRLTGNIQPITSSNDNLYHVTMTMKEVL